MYLEFGYIVFFSLSTLSMTDSVMPTVAIGKYMFWVFKYFNVSTIVKTHKAGGHIILCNLKRQEGASKLGV